MDQKSVTVDTMETSLHNLPKMFLEFSGAMVRLFRGEAVGGTDKAAVEFRYIRDEIRKDAMVYLEKNIPQVKNFVSNLQIYFENYSDLSFEDWDESLEDIADDCKEYKILASDLIKIHDKLCENLNERLKRTTLVLNDLGELSEELKKRKIDKSMKQELRIAKKIANKQEAKNMKAAFKTVREELIYCLAHFNQDIKVIAKWFIQIHLDLLKLNERKDDDDLEKIKEKKENHYDLLKEKSECVIKGCRHLYGAIPAVASNLESIPKEGTDKSYVDQWVTDKEKKISEEQPERSYISRTMMAVKTSVKNIVQTNNEWLHGQASSMTENYREESSFDSNNGEGDNSANQDNTGWCDSCGYQSYRVYQILGIRWYEQLFPSINH